MFCGRISSSSVAGRDVPLVVAQLVYEPVLGFVGSDLERLVERAVGPDHPQIAAEYDQRFPHRFHDAGGELAGVLGLSLTLVDGPAYEPARQHRDDHATDEQDQGETQVRPLLAGSIEGP